MSPEKRRGLLLVNPKVTEDAKQGRRDRRVGHGFGGRGDQRADHGSLSRLPGADTGVTTGSAQPSVDLFSALDV